MEKKDTKKVFVAGLVVGVLGLCTIGFFVLLGMKAFGSRAEGVGAAEAVKTVAGAPTAQQPTEAAAKPQAAPVEEADWAEAAAAWRHAAGVGVVERTTEPDAVGEQDRENGLGERGSVAAQAEAAAAVAAERRARLTREIDEAAALQRIIGNR